jgi:hypothetical protein
MGTVNNVLSALLNISGYGRVHWGLGRCVSDTGNKQVRC